MHLSKERFTLRLLFFLLSIVCCFALHKRGMTDWRVVVGATRGWNRNRNNEDAGRLVVGVMVVFCYANCWHSTYAHSKTVKHDLASILRDRIGCFFVLFSCVTLLLAGWIVSLEFCLRCVCVFIILLFSFLFVSLFFCECRILMCFTCLTLR